MLQISMLLIYTYVAGETSDKQTHWCEINKIILKLIFVAASVSRLNCSSAA